MINVNTDTIPLLNRDNNAFSSVIVPLDVRGEEIARGVVTNNDHKAMVVKVLDIDLGRYIDIREWTRYGKETSFNPSKHGVCIKSDKFRDSLIEILNNSLKYC
jgi:hypothetical protein